MNLNCIFDFSSCLLPPADRLISTSNLNYEQLTNIISELARPQPNAGVLQSSIALTVITLEEIYYGLTSKPNARINTWFQQFLNYYCQIIPITSEIALYAGEIRGKLRTQGKTRSQADMLIAATAKSHKLTLVTRNIRDFEGCEILLFNPFS